MPCLQFIHIVNATEALSESDSLTSNGPQPELKYLCENLGCQSANIIILMFTLLLSHCSKKYVGIPEYSTASSR